MRFRAALAFSGLVLWACGPADDVAAGGSRSSEPGPEPAGAVDVPTRVAPEEDASRPRAREEDELRVVFLGTSLTAGRGLRRDSERYTARLQALADSAGLPVRMVNAGVSGETSAGGLRRLDWVLDQAVDVVVVELGANDGLRGHDPESLASNLHEIVRRTHARHPDASVILVAMEAPPNMGARYADRFRAVFPRVAEETGAELAPFLLEGVAGVAELNQSDRIHPTAEGHRLMARNLWPVLEPVLRREARETGLAGGTP